MMPEGRIRATLVTHTPISFDLSGVTRGERVRDTKISGMFSKLLRIVFLCIITLFYRHIYVYVGSHRYTTVVDKLDLRRSPSPNKNHGYAYGSQFNFTGFVVAPSEHFVVLVKCYWALAGRSS